MINFTRAFDLAWERTVVILFRPFDLGKWFVIGFGAFLAGFMHGGNGFSGSSSFPDSKNHPSLSYSGFQPPSVTDSMRSIVNFVMGLEAAMLIAMVTVVFLIFAGVAALLFWLGSRGQFLFLDNIVRNRGTVEAPWRYYGPQANSFFWVYFALAAISFLIVLPFLAGGVVMGLPFLTQHRWPAGFELARLAGLGFAYFLIAIGLSIVRFLYLEFGTALMFRRGILAWPAALAVVDLVVKNPVNIAIFLLLRLAIFIAVTILSVVICCASCCFYMLPYLGTVLILPALVFTRCFTLDCLAQFGPEFDVWTVDVAPAPGPVSPQPPLG